MIFGLLLVAAIIIAVIVLVTVSLNGENSKPAATTPPPSQAPATQTPAPTPTPTPTPNVTSIKIYYYNSERTEFSVGIGGTPTPMNAVVYPKDVQADVNWSIGDESIATITVNDDGTVEVTGVKAGNTTLTAECGGVKAVAKVYVSG
jgi:uncharacterized protein YjdB